MIYGMSLVEAHQTSTSLELPTDLGRCTTLTDEVTVDSLTPCGVKPNLLVTRHHDPSGSTRMLGMKTSQVPVTLLEVEDKP
jgi:hypothetical protein